MAIKKDRGFILKTFDFRETSKIVHIFTEKSGKIAGLLKGFRTGKKEFSTPLNTFSLNEVVFYESKSDLWLISHADIINDFSFLTDTTEKNLVANFIVELIDKINPLHYPQPQIFWLIDQAFSHLKGHLQRKILYVFEIKTLELSGFKPHLTACVKCANEVKKEASFSVKLGGLLCPNCKSYDSFCRNLSPELISGLKYIQNNDFEVSLRLNFSSETEKQIFEILEDFLSFHIDARIKTLSSVASLKE